jgi:glycopeptide antibiotics resistance protein
MYIFCKSVLKYNDFSVVLNQTSLNLTTFIENVMKCVFIIYISDVVDATTLPYKLDQI